MRALWLTGQGFQTLVAVFVVLVIFAGDGI